MARLSGDTAYSDHKTAKSAMEVLYTASQTSSTGQTQGGGGEPEGMTTSIIVFKMHGASFTSSSLVYTFRSLNTC